MLRSSKCNLHKGNNSLDKQTMCLETFHTCTLLQETWSILKLQASLNSVEILSLHFTAVSRIIATSLHNHQQMFKTVYHQPQWTDVTNFNKPFSSQVQSWRNPPSYLDLWIQTSLKTLSIMCRSTKISYSKRSTILSRTCRLLSCHSRQLLNDISILMHQAT